MATSNTRKKPEWISVDKLLLDGKNFRLPEDAEGSSQNELIELLARDYSLTELGRSLVDNGYFSEEPLIAIRAPKDKFIVVEGNRRLAALKLLLSADLAKNLKLREWIDLRKEYKGDELSSVPVIVYESREELVPYLGFRHITGVKKWEPYAKARFVDYLVLERNRSFKEVGREIGSKGPAIKGMYVAYRLVVQARDRFDIETERVERDFGVLLRSLNSIAVRKFIGLDWDKSEAALKHPVPTNKADHVKELFEWVFGTSTQRAVLTDSRQITQLGEVLDTKEGVLALRAGADLQSAYRLGGGEQSQLKQLLSHLTTASIHLDETLKDAHRHAGNKDVEKKVARCWTTMNELIRHFPAVRSKVEQ